LDAAFGYRFDAPDRSIVISGNTAATDSVVNAGNGCDVLLHEMYDDSISGSSEGNTPSPYFSAFHINPQELAAIAGKARPSCWSSPTRWGSQLSMATCSMLCALLGIRAPWSRHTT